MQLSDGLVVDPVPDERAPASALARRIQEVFAQGAPNGIVQIGVPVAEMDALEWLHAQQRAEKMVFWEDREDALSVAGIGRADEIVVDEALPLEDVSKRIEQAIARRGGSEAVRYYGGVRFNPQVKPSFYWEAFGTARFVLPRFELRQEAGSAVLLCNLVPEEDGHRVDEIARHAEELCWPSANGSLEAYCPEARTNVPSRRNWIGHVEVVLGRLRGDERKVVMAREAAYGFEAPLEATALFKAVRRTTPGAFHFLVQPEADTAFVGASPERLFSKRGRRVYSEAVAGTRPRASDPGKDERFRRALLASDKDRREHEFVRQSLMGALQGLCERLHVDQGVTELMLPRSRHLIARLEGRLLRSVSSLGVLAALHPSPAVGGWPTGWAVEQIEENEAFDRGWYAGPVGWIGPEDAEFAVAIRSGLVRGETLRLYSGAGIVEGSDPEAEWNEIEQKITDFIDALGLGS